MIFLVRRYNHTFFRLVQFNEDFSDTPHAICLFVWNVSYIPDASFSEVFLLHATLSEELPSGTPYASFIEIFICSWC